MKTAIDDELLSTIAGLMDEVFTVEGAVYYLLGTHPDFTENPVNPRSVAWMLSVGLQEPVLQELEAMSREAKAETARDEA